VLGASRGKSVGCDERIRDDWKPAALKRESLKLYNEKGESGAVCEKKGDTFTNCKMDSGVTLDDVMNAWVHALEDFGK
jgi:hypothetical protein